MISWFTEDAIFPMVTGAILVIIFIALAISSREKIMLYVAFGITAMVVFTVVCEHLIVTQKEEITETVYDLAEMVEANDVAGVAGFVSKSRPDTIDRINREMPGYDFDTCRFIGTNYFEPDENSNAKATICFTVTFRVSLVNQGQDSIPGQRRVTLDFEKDEDGKWRIIDYEHQDPRKSLKL